MRFIKPLIYFFFSVVILVTSGGLAHAKKCKMKYKGMDKNHDCVVTRDEWQGNDQSFQNADWNEDGVLSGNEVKAGARRNGNNYNNSFANLDSNGDNVISRNEWRSDRGTFDRMDCNHDSLLTQNEFLSQTECNTTISNAAFRNLDTNNDNYISRNEWRSDSNTFARKDCNHDSLLTQNEFLSQTECNTTISNAAFRNLDTNNDNYISRNEWRSDSNTFDRKDCNHDSLLTQNEFLSQTECNTTISNTTFRSLDTNNDNYISRNEWRDTNQAFVNKDCNRDNRLSRTEFFTQNCTTPTCDINCLFREVDVNDDGYIDRTEWRGNAQTFNQLDQNRDNILTRNEFSYINQYGQGKTQQVLGTVSDVLNAIFGQ